MRPGCGLFCVLFLGVLLRAESPRAIPAPLYAPSSIVNSANGNTPALASNTIATLFGSDLAFTTRGVTGEEIRRGMMPTVLIGTGVRVTVNNIQAAIYYVSPTQINFLMPDVSPGEAEVRVSRDSAYGPAARVRTGEFSPALFQMDPEFAIATRADGSLITREVPARPNEIVILYATGLGPTRPRFLNGEVPARAAVLDRLEAFRVVIGDTQLPPGEVLYAGVAPGFPGLYQVNLRLPARLDRNSLVQIGFGQLLSARGVRLWTESGNP